MKTQLSLFSIYDSINMIHISPWGATLGLMKMARNTLIDNGILYCYGPYKEKTTAESNL